MSFPDPETQWSQVRLPLFAALGLCGLVVLVAVGERGGGDGGREEAGEVSRKGAAVRKGAGRAADGGTLVRRGEDRRLAFAEPVEVRPVRGNWFEGRVFRVRAGLATGRLTMNGFSFSAVEAEYDGAAFRRLVEGRADGFELPLDGESSVAVEVERVISRGEATKTVVGKVAGDPLSQVLLVFHDGAVSGSVAFYGRDEHYEFGSAGNGNVAIRHLNPGAFVARCGHPGEGEAERAGGGAGEVGFPEEAGLGVGEPGGKEVVIDTVVGYGYGARVAEGGVAAMEAKIIASVDRMNAAFGNSGIDGITVVLLGTVEDPGYVFPGEEGGEMGSADELGHLDNESDGILDVVTDFKNELGADTAAFVVTSADGSAGIAYRPGESMVVARTYMTSARLTYAHEFGHNIGCRHAWGDTGTDSLVTVHNYGWRLRHSGSVRARTVMAYDWDWPRIPYFSNPDVRFNGSRTGAEDGYDATGDATADPVCVSGGAVGDAGAGYDGSHSALGARNADCILENAAAVADNRERSEPDIHVELADGPVMGDGGGTVAFDVAEAGMEVTKTFVIRNEGEFDLTGLAVSVDGEGAGWFSVGAPGVSSLAPGEATTFGVTFSPESGGVVSAEIRIASNDPDENPYEIVLSGGVRGVFYQEDFEDGMGIWSMAPNSFAWTRNSFGTPSSSTGPAAAFSGSHYLYTEATGHYHGVAGVLADFDLSGQTGRLLRFRYQMYGSAMGDLFVDVHDGEWHEGVWARSGEQHESGAVWSKAEVDLEGFDHAGGVTIRFRGRVGGSFRSDMAIDLVEILTAVPEEEALLLLEYAAGPGGILAGETSQSVAGGGDGSPVTAVPGGRYHFVGWSDGSTANPRQDTGVTAAVSVTARFERDGFADWAAKEGLSGAAAGAGAAPFGDGVPNLLKFAFNMDGGGPDFTVLAAGSGTAGLPVLTEAGGGYAFEFLRMKGGVLEYEPQWSESLEEGAWEEVSGVETVTDLDDYWERVSVVPGHDPEAGPLFLRVRVTEP